MESLQLPAVEFFKIKVKDGVEIDGKMIKP